MYLLRTVKVFCSFMRFILSPPCLGYSFAGVAIRCHVLSPRAAGVCSGYSIDSPVAGGIQCLCPQLPCPIDVVGTEHLSLELPGQPTHHASFPEPAAHPTHQAPVTAPDWLPFLACLVQALT